MIPMSLTDATRSMKAPQNWDVETDGPCMTLDIHDHIIEGKPVMVSAWTFEQGELEKLQAGAPLYLRIFGTNHPVVSLFAGEPPEVAS